MSNLAKKYNLKSPAVKRLMREAAELSEPTEQYFAQPLEDNLFEWHFTVRGPPDTEFSEGRYHGRITLPAEYPMKPPSIILITANGRFEVGKKICLSMSAHHPETWQPSWSIRTVILALIGFMPTKGGGAIGALDYTSEERAALAEKSKRWKCEYCGQNGETCLLEVDPDHQKEHINEVKELANQINFKGEADKNKSETQDPQIPNQTSPVGPAGTINQQSLNYFSQLYGMYNQPGLIPPHADQSSRTCEPSATSGNDIATTNTTTMQNNPSRPVNETEGIRHRTHVLAPDEGQANSVNSTGELSARVRNTSNRWVDGITLTLMWIVTALLIVLILRRLAMEGASLRKA